MINLLENGKLTVEEIRDCTGVTRDRIESLAFMIGETAVSENENKSMDETLAAIKCLAEDMIVKACQLELKHKEYQEHEGNAIYEQLRSKLRFERWREREQGRLEVQCKVARDMLMVDEEVEYIADVTGLSESEVDKLKKTVLD